MKTVMTIKIIIQLLLEKVVARQIFGRNEIGHIKRPFVAKRLGLTENDVTVGFSRRRKEVKRNCSRHEVCEVTRKKDDGGIERDEEGSGIVEERNAKVGAVRRKN